MSEIRDVSLHLHHTSGAVGAAKAAVDGLPLDDHLEAQFNLRLMVAELVGTSGGEDDPASTITLKIVLEPRSVRAVVGRRSRDSFQPGFGRQLPAGRGVRLLDALADRWGTGRGHDGESLVWFELDLAAR